MRLVHRTFMSSLVVFVILSESRCGFVAGERLETNLACRVPAVRLAHICVQRRYTQQLLIKSICLSLRSSCTVGRLGRLSDDVFVRIRVRASYDCTLILARISRESLRILYRRLDWVVSRRSSL